MRFLFPASLALILFIASGCARSAEESHEAYLSEGYELVWADEFNGHGSLNPKDWISETGFVRNEEHQWYQSENAFQKDGLLIIEARREQIKNPGHIQGSKNWKKNRAYAEYSSSCVKTKGLREWLYGRFEMRARIDTRLGMWPTFWTMGSGREWPACGEIDIMEYYRGGLRANVCWASPIRWTPIWDVVVKQISDFDDPQWNNKFHLWRMDWDTESIRLYLDGELVNETNLERTINRNRERANPFHEPQYILLNLAIGGSQGGDPSKTEFPAQFEIDWVRVYQTAPVHSQ